jgi:adenylate cyclase
VTSDDRAAALGRVRSFLLGAGVGAGEIDRAEREDLLDLLVADRLLVPSERRYSESEVAARTGMPVELARKFWRALGFPDPGPEDRIFTDLDIEAILIINGVLALDVADVESALQLARVIGSSMARIAEAEVSPGVMGVPFPGPAGLADSVEAADIAVRLAEPTLPAMARLLEFAWRRHVQAAIRRAMLLRSRRPGTMPALCVGFADMVGFTMLSQQLSEDELAVVVGRFEEVAHYTVTGGGGRLVKMIGDEAMFVSESPAAAARIALGLAEAYADDELLSDVRVGLAEGPVLSQDGDYYGPVVNLAHAIVAIADPGSVVLSDDFHGALLRELHPAGGNSDGDGEFSFRAIRPRQLKDLGRVQLWVLHRPGTEPALLERRIGRRWDRLAEVLSDIEELRDRGEKLITEGLRAAVRMPDGQEEPEEGDDGEAPEEPAPAAPPGEPEARAEESGPAEPAGRE